MKASQDETLGIHGAWERGIWRIVEMCKEAGNPTPKWKLEPGGDGLWLRFPFSAKYQAADSPAGSAATLKITLKTTPETTPERILVLRKSIPKSLSVCLSISRLK